jgi:hypothetical protein
MKKVIAVLAVALFICGGEYLAKHARPVDDKPGVWGYNGSCALRPPPFGDNGTETKYLVKDAFQKIEADKALSINGQWIEVDYSMCCGGVD